MIQFACPKGARGKLTSAALLLVFAADLAACRKRTAGEEEEKTPAVDARCAKLERVGIDEVVTLRGRTAPPPGGDLPVAPQVPGRVIEVRVHEGDHVARGAVLAVMDDLAPRAASKEADAALARARAADVQAQAALARAEDLAGRGISSTKDVEDALSRAASAHAEVVAGEAALRLASGTLGRTEVRSQFDGVVTKVWRGAGALVDGTAATPVVQIASTGAIEFVADSTERDLAPLREGQKAEITLSLHGVRLVGTVLARARALDTATGLGAVRIAIEGPAPEEAKDDEVKKDDAKGDTKKAEEAKDEKAAREATLAAVTLGAFGKVTIGVGHRDGVLVVPPSALRGAAADGAEVAVCKGDKIEIRAVHVGYRDAERIEIASGLEQGEQVATAHVLGLEDGTKLADPKKGDEKGDEKGKDEKGKRGEGDEP
jgi:RND family efflux transporter MFP subunit